jgi:hypothetical protein
MLIRAAAKSAVQMYKPFARVACLVVLIFLGASICRAEEVLLQTKSYIAPLNLSDAQQWDPDAKSCQTAMAAIVSCGTKFGENPADGAKESGDYRLLSQVKVDMHCVGEKVSDWNVHPVEMDFGKEFYFISTSGSLAKPLNVVPSPTGKSSVDKVTINYRVQGQPNSLGITSMNLAKSRTCSKIWHDVSATLTCKAGKSEVTSTLTGSSFPSHTMWVQGKIAKRLVQGPFRNLWKCDPADPTSVQ